MLIRRVYLFGILIANLCFGIRVTGQYSELYHFPPFPVDIEDVLVSGNILYVSGGVSYRSFLSAYSIVNPLSPTWLSTQVFDDTSALDIRVYELSIYGDYLFGSGETGSGLMYFDLSDPANPTYAGQLLDISTASGDETHGISSKAHLRVGDIMYIQFGSSGLGAVDISNLASPVLLDMIQYTGVMYNPMRLADENSLLFIDGYSLYVLDISNPSDLVKETIPIYGDPGGLELSPDSSHAYVTSNYWNDEYLSTVDLSTNTVVDTLGLKDYAGAVGEMALNAEESLLYIGARGEFLVLDISNMGKPVLVAEIDEPGSWGGDDCIVYENGLIYIADGDDLYIFGSSSVSVATQLGVPSEFALHPAFPNPFNPSTTIQFDLPQATDIRIVVYDLLGREVTRLVNDRLEAGNHQVNWNGKAASGLEVPTGIYIARLVTPESTKSIKMVLLR